MRPSWDQYFISMAHLASVRSHDEQTQVGCVIVNENNHIVSLGYNGFPAGTKDCDLPKVRPGKYPYMLHAEQNAISNMNNKQGKLRAYITAFPCCVCAKLLWQNNIRELIVDKNGTFYSMTQSDTDVMKFLMDNGLNIKTIEVNIDIFSKLNSKFQRGK